MCDAARCQGQLIIWAAGTKGTESAGSCLHCPSSGSSSRSVPGSLFWWRHRQPTEWKRFRIVSVFHILHRRSFVYTFRAKRERFLSTSSTAVKQHLHRHEGKISCYYSDSKIQAIPAASCILKKKKNHHLTNFPLPAVCQLGPLLQELQRPCGLFKYCKVLNV